MRAARSLDAARSWAMRDLSSLMSELRDGDGEVDIALEGEGRAMDLCMAKAGLPGMRGLISTGASWISQCHRS